MKLQLQAAQEGIKIHPNDNSNENPRRAARHTLGGLIAEPGNRGDQRSPVTLDLPVDTFHSKPPQGALDLGQAQ